MPGEASASPVQDTLETSLCTLHLLPANGGPGQGCLTPLYMPNKLTAVIVFGV
jgi:hypothetical protein